MLKAGDSNQRVREKAQTTLFMLAMSPVGPERVAAAGLHDPQKGQKKPLNYRVHSARLSLVRVLVAKVGLNRKEQRTGLTAENVTKGLCVPLLSHASGDVRDAAVGLIVLLHEHVMDSVMQKLLGDVKPLQLQAIEEQLANTRQSGGGGSKPSATNDKQPELASSSISVERGGRHPVLDAARAAGGGTKDEVSAPPPAAGPKSTKQRQEEEREAAERAAKTCQFCGRHDPKFTDDLLDEHYARACPMLIACPLCQQVTEIPTLQQHLIGECNRATAVRQCPTCREAVPVAEFDEHVAASACIPHSPQYNVCPLCHEKLPPTEQGWDDHLLKAPGCANNARPYDGAGASEL
jgi:centrosomal protein CEP104